MGEHPKESTILMVDELVEFLLKNQENLQEFAEDSSKKEQLVPILRSIILAPDKENIKNSLKEFIEKLKDFGIKLGKESEDDIPILWSNGRPGNVFITDEYNKKHSHYGDTDSPIFRVLWNIMPKVFSKMEALGKEKFNGTYCQEMLNLGNSIGVNHIPYDRLLSELWVEEMPLNTILKGDVRVEFGQNREEESKKSKAEKAYLTTDSVLSLSELPILLDRIAQHNVNMDLVGTPNEKVYLENIGVSEDEIISGNYKDIKERYSEDRDNPNAGCIVLRKVERSLDGKISTEFIRTPVKLKFMILKLEKQRLKEIEKRLGKIEEITIERIIRENSDITNSFSSEKRQHAFVEKVRQKTEKGVPSLFKVTAGSKEGLFKRFAFNRTVIGQQDKSISKKEQEVSSHLEALLRKREENEMTTENSHSFAG